MADYELTFVIPEEHAIRARDGLAGSFGNGMEDGESKAAYIHRKMLTEMKRRVLRYERQQAIDSLVIDPIDIS